jgi:hypothetical protein
MTLLAIRSSRIPLNESTSNCPRSPDPPLVLNRMTAPNSRPLPKDQFSRVTRPEAQGHSAIATAQERSRSGLAPNTSIAMLQPVVTVGSCFCPKTVFYSTFYLFLQSNQSPRVYSSSYFQTSSLSLRVPLVLVSPSAVYTIEQSKLGSTQQ